MTIERVLFTAKRREMIFTAIRSGAQLSDAVAYAGILVEQFQRHLTHGEQLLTAAYDDGTLTPEKVEEAGTIRPILVDAGWDETAIIDAETAEEWPRANAAAAIGLTARQAKSTSGAKGLLAATRRKKVEPGQTLTLVRPEPKSSVEPSEGSDRFRGQRARTRKPEAPHDPVANQERFLAAFEECSHIERAAQAAGISPRLHYKWLTVDPTYPARFSERRRLAVGFLADKAVELATVGQEFGVWHDGQKVGSEYRIDSRVLLRLLEAHDPSTYSPRQNLTVDPGPKTLEDSEKRRALLGAMADPETLAEIEALADRLDRAATLELGPAPIEATATETLPEAEEA